VIEKPIMFRTAASCKTLAATLLLVFGHSLGASAHLGGDVSSVADDAHAMHASIRSTPLVAYEVHEFQSSSGLAVREYVAATGTVFALSWRGAVAPDLQLLLGEHFSSYAVGVAALRHAGLQRALRIAAGGLVVEFSGHPRSYFGHAYLPAELPPGFDVHTLR
jgi:hypothetical protein